MAMEQRCHGCRPRRLFSPLLFVAAVSAQHQSYAVDEYNNDDPNSLANGLFQTATPVADWAAVALDLRAMHKALHTDDIASARDIYLNGRYSPILDATSGQPTQHLRTLASFSTNANMAHYDHDPEYLYQIYGLAKGDPDRARGVYSTYGNDFILAEMQSSKAEVSTLAAEAALVLNVHQGITHKLHDALQDCTDQMMSSTSAETTTVPGNFDKAQLGTDSMTATAIKSLDAAIALYVGAHQIPASPRGYSLYALSERTAELFGTLSDPTSGGSSLSDPTSGGSSQSEPSSGGSSLANLSLHRFYEEAKHLLSQPFSCAGPHSDTYGQLYQIVNKITSISLIPLVQMLHVALVDRDLPRIKLYSLAVVPRLIACSPSTQAYLTEKLLGSEHYNPDDYEDIVAALRSTYDCLGFKCKIIGTFPPGQDYREPCVDKPQQASLGPVFVTPQHQGEQAQDADETGMDLSAGPTIVEWYHPTTMVRNLAKIDLDVHQMEILCSFGDWSGARSLYEHGKNSDSGISLKLMATDNRRFVVGNPWIGYYRSYKNRNDSDFADTLIKERLNGNGKWGAATTAQRTASAVNIVRYQVILGYSLYKLHDALSLCKSGNVESMASWDGAVALTVGSMERGKHGDGQLLYTLANDLCADFDTCESSPYASDEQFVDQSQLISVYHQLFYTGKMHLTNGDCTGVESVVSKLRIALVAPLLQATVRAAAESQNLPANSYEVQVAEAEAYALSILPLVGMDDVHSAMVLERNMRMREDVEPVQDGAQAVADALWTSSMNLNNDETMCQKFLGSRYQDASSGASSETVEVCNSSAQVTVGPFALTATFLASMVVSLLL